MSRYNRPIRVFHKGMYVLIAMFIATALVAPGSSTNNPTKPTICYFPDCQIY